jgi:hypothetical protein
LRCALECSWRFKFLVLICFKQPLKFRVYVDVSESSKKTLRWINLSKQEIKTNIRIRQPELKYAELTIVFYIPTAKTIWPRKLKFWLPTSFGPTWCSTYCIQNFEVQVPKGSHVREIPKTGFRGLKLFLSCSGGRF